MSEVFTVGDQRVLKRAGMVYQDGTKAPMLTERAHQVLRQLEEEPFDLKATLKKTSPQPSAGAMEILRQGLVMAAGPRSTEDGDGES